MRKIVLWLAGVIFGVGAIGYFGVANMPLTKINDFAPNFSLSATGTLSDGAINGVKLNGQALTLSCELSGNVLSTDFTCDKPLAITGKVRVSVDGTATLSATSIKGELKNAADWMRVLQLPPGLNADVDVQIANAKVVNGYGKPLLSQLDVSGNIKDISIMRFPVFTEATITTQKTNNPIELTIEARNANQQNSQLNLVSVITDNEYETTGTLTGENLGMLSGVLSYFGRPISPNEWQIMLKGRVM